jgi:hypothetical protein
MPNHNSSQSQTANVGLDKLDFIHTLNSEKIQMSQKKNE